MKPIRDPERAELKHLVAVCPLSGKVVLEIGCGDGTFTRQYAPIAQHVVGIDPTASDVRQALNKIHSGRARNTHFLLAEGENLPFPDQIFDVAIFASSL
jgi:ubiquinone/menaquinone biosynthesis C-methylase UbiE